MGAPKNSGAPAPETSLWFYYIQNLHSSKDPLQNTVSRCLCGGGGLPLPRLWAPDSGSTWFAAFISGRRHRRPQNAPFAVPTKHRSARIRHKRIARRHGVLRPATVEIAGPHTPAPPSTGAGPRNAPRPHRHSGTRHMTQAGGQFLRNPLNFRMFYAVHHGD